MNLGSVSCSTETTEVYTPQVADELKPTKNRQFRTLDDFFEFYNKYAFEAGFSVRRSSTAKSKDGSETIRQELCCRKEGHSQKHTALPKKRKGIIRTGCLAKIAVVKRCGIYVITQFTEAHNHPLTTPERVHLLPSHRQVSNATKCLTMELGLVNIPTHQQISLLEVQSGGIENMAQREKNSFFNFKIEEDSENRIKHCFWADATSRRAYSFFGDVVIFDTTYNTNKYRLIFAPLLGVNHHGQTIMFGCAFLGDESTESFVWLLNTFLEAMPGRSPPKMIITDQDPAMKIAISQVLPNTFHRYCSWHILNKFSEKIGAVKCNEYYDDFRSCVWNSEMTEEFDKKWKEVVEKSGLSDNGWLQSIYDIRASWVPAYCNHIFSAGMSSSQRAESCHSFFKKYVDHKNSLLDFVIRFNRGLVHQRHQELVSTHIDANEEPQLNTPHPMESQMSGIYTRACFQQFQSEFYISFFNYRFQLMREDDNQRLYLVKKRSDQIQKDREIVYDKHTDLVSCTCKKFQSEGIPCRHILGYLLKVQEVDYLPDQYILNRWTKAANATVVKDLDGLEITDTNALVVKRSKLFHHASLVIDKVLTNPDEAQTMFIEALDNVLDKIKQMQVNSSESASIGKKFPSDVQHRYNEPKIIKAKASGKRLKKSKEKTERKRSSTRKCHGCGLYGQLHDKRNCPALNMPKDSSVLDKYADKDEDDHETISTDEDEDPSSFDEDYDN
ncbi:protein FAR1-RELATED SEQUENCE 5-like [Rosa rugosa]|uniref:protein FAR1-RELATED SEQUENCE 5-like n=1 Tax=Rosa rugosa TaxID=74645 RepID=UPI002B40DC55|nr:protein FAR1-RELATED SEQUENCE 5-like [Rosa rugosa]